MFPMPRSTPPFPTHSFGSSPFSYGMFQGGVQPLGSLPMQQGAVNKTGGLLSRLFGGASNASAVPNTFAGNAASSMMPNMFSGANQASGMIPNMLGGANAVNSLSNVAGGAKAAGGLSNILSMLQNAQKAIGVVQTVGPMVQQYAPIVKSLPALISIMRGSDTSENIEEESSEIVSKEQQSTTTNKTNKNKITNEKALKATEKQKEAKKEFPNGLPAPKLYI